MCPHRLHGWLLGTGLISAGLVHIVRPRTLLALARKAYDLVLAVEFTPRAAAPQRVQAVGGIMIGVGCGILMALFRGFVTVPKFSSIW